MRPRGGPQCSLPPQLWQGLPWLCSTCCGAEAGEQDREAFLLVPHHPPPPSRPALPLGSPSYRKRQARAREGWSVSQAAGTFCQPTGEHKTVRHLAGHGALPACPAPSLPALRPHNTAHRLAQDGRRFKPRALPLPREGGESVGLCWPLSQGGQEAAHAVSQEDSPASGETQKISPSHPPAGEGRGPQSPVSPWT